MMINHKSFLSIWIVLFVLGGTGLAQTSDSTRKTLAPFYAQFEFGYGLPERKCNLELSASAGVGVHVFQGLDLGITYFLNHGLGRLIVQNERMLHGLGIQARYQWRKVGFIAEVGQSLRFRDGCQREW
ncbi:MAG: hypothetical protein AAGM67_08360, partial [Bacteroidota bacterium]